eukprot:NODE_833_length_753_cov_506.694602_g638_i0.p1 GENE.NODE_833_length_753_cov_506.694602_g638_i0~~NODE_833_length_753_cov_506.694602_g638_i0.p1  ORF type:complete len:194 (+),score=19.39 NODE_833_length_753_cov_506.694602_g638_i0:29-610(+)
MGLPDEIIGVIVTYADAKSLLFLACVNSEYHERCLRENLWEAICKAHLPDVTVIPARFTWKRIFRHPDFQKRRVCPHLCHALPVTSHTLPAPSSCPECSAAAARSCLRCGYTACARQAGGHCLKHWQSLDAKGKLEHGICAHLDSNSNWCYGCHKWLDGKLEYIWLATLRANIKDRFPDAHEMPLPLASVLPW